MVGTSLLLTAANGVADASRQIQTLIQENRPGIRDFTQNGLNQLGDLVTDLKRFVASMSRFASLLLLPLLLSLPPSQSITGTTRRSS